MDRNTVIGFLLIAVIFIGYSIYSKKTSEDTSQDQIVEEVTDTATLPVVEREEIMPEKEDITYDIKKEVADNEIDPVEVESKKDKFGVFSSAFSGDG